MILALDQGSSSSRCIAFDAVLRQVASASVRVTTSRPRPGWVEHDAAALLDGVRQVLGEVAAAVGEVTALAIANQTESFVLWEASTGRPLTPVISWQDQRAAELCQALAKDPGADRVAAVTGLALDTTFAAPKVAWLFERDHRLRARASAGEVLFGDVASFIAWQLSAGAAHITEPSNASRTLLLGLGSLDWDPGLVELFGLPWPILPEIRPTDHLEVATTAAGAGFEAPLVVAVGDQPAALFGHGCTGAGQTALTLGTGAFLWRNAGPAPPSAPTGVLATVAWGSRLERAYALEAFCANAGNALAVLRGLGFAAGDGVPDWERPLPVIVPAPGGLATPHWDPADRITLLHASGSTTAADLAAAGRAGVAHQIADALAALGVEPGDAVRVGGGLAADAGLVQAIADLSGVILDVSAELEATARGAAALAARAIGAIGDPPAPPIARRVVPVLGAAGRERERARWQRAVAVHLASGPE